MIILDTDHISALQHRDGLKAFALQARLETLSLYAEHTKIWIFGCHG
jgi:hypothetical protein